MSNQENNNKSNNSGTSDANTSTDKGKTKLISAISNSATELIRETLIPLSGTNTTTLLQQINNQKPQSSTTSTSNFFLQELNNKFSQEENENRFHNVNYNNDENYDIEKDWDQWIIKHNAQNIDKIEPCPSAKLHMYPLHHHYPHKTNLLNEDFKDGNEILGFLNSNDYTNQVYNEEITNIREGSKFNLEEFLESEDVEKYLLKNTYTDDVYGIPKFLKKLIIEAKNELNNQNDQGEDITLKRQKTAIERLKMVKDHLIEKRKLNNSDNNNINNNNNDNDKLFNNWLDKWTEQDVKDI
jgi:hypothetical protein